MTDFRELPIRDDLRGEQPYGAPQLAVPVQLNVNENPHAPSAALVHDILAEASAAVADANRYPDREFTDLRAALAGYLGHGLGATQLWAANGSNEIFQQFLQAFGGPGRTMLGFDPTYSMYPLLSRITGTEYLGAPRLADFEITAEHAVAAVEAHRPDVVVLCRPNNPTGTGLGLDVVEAVYAATPGMVIVDEAYQEFSEAPSAAALLPGRERLAISRTMSKAFAFASIRLGYLAADAAVIDALRIVRLPYHLSGLTQAAARVALRHAPELLATVQDIKRQRDRIAAALPGLGYRPYPSESNFVLFDGVADPKRTFQGLLDRGVIVRDIGIPHTLRVTAGTGTETSAFLKALAVLPND